MKKLCLLFALLILICALAAPVLAADMPVLIAGDTYYDSVEKAFVYYADTVSMKAIRSSVADGMITAQPVSIRTDAGLAMEVYRDGEQLDSISGGTFQTPGEYVVMYTGSTVSERVFSFTIVPEVCNYITGYMLPAGFEIVEASRDGEAVDYDGNYISFMDEGEYYIQYRCVKADSSYELRVRTDYTGPVLSLEEVVDGAARGPVDISEAKKAAVVNIYHDGERISKKDVLTESGEYYIELADEAGNKSTYSFTILIYFDGNSWLFFVLILGSCVAIIIYLLHSRKHLRVR